MKKQLKKDRESSSIARLPDAELEVLACLLQKGKARSKDILEMMKSYRPMTQGSMLTLIKRLENKGLVTRERISGKEFIFKPTKGRKPAYRQIAGDIMQRIYRGNSLALVVSIFETKPPTPSELKKLEQYLKELSNTLDKDISDGTGN